MRRIGIAIGCVVASASLAAQSVATLHLAQTKLEDRTPALSTEDRLPAISREPAPAPQHTRVGVVSDWSQHHVLFSATRNPALLVKSMNDPRRTQSWYLHHRGTWWPGMPHGHLKTAATVKRDWNTLLGTATFEPIFDYSFNISPESGFGSLNSIEGAVLGGSYSGDFLPIYGSLTVSGTSAFDAGTYPLVLAGPAPGTSPFGGPTVDNLLYPMSNPQIDSNGLLFGSSALQINLAGAGPGSYTYSDYTGSTLDHTFTSGTMSVNTDPGGGQSYPAKYTFDVTASPSCTGDYVVVGIPANGASGGQANIVGYNNLYTNSTGTGFCPTLTGPSVMFAYATANGGQVPGSVAISLNGSQLAFVENLANGTSYFHVLTIGTSTGHEGTGPTAAVTPGVSPSNSSDNSVALQLSSTTGPFIDYQTNSAYLTTYDWANTTGYLYKFNGVFGTGSAPTLAWKVALSVVPSAPIYDSASNNVYFTDSSGNIDFITDNGASGSSVTSLNVAPGSTSLNPVTLDGTNEIVYATFNNDALGNEIVVQAPISALENPGPGGVPVVIPIGQSNLTFTGPYGVEFNDYWYNGAEAPNETAPVLFVNGTCMTSVCGSATTSAQTATSYVIGFLSGTGSALDPLSVQSLSLTGGASQADTSAPTEFYNPNTVDTQTGKTGADYLYFGLTYDCGVTPPNGCLLWVDLGNLSSSLGFVNGYEVVGGTSGVVVDNQGTANQESNIYFMTKLGQTQNGVQLNQPSLIKLTQNGLF